MRRLFHSSTPNEHSEIHEGQTTEYAEQGHQCPETKWLSISHVNVG